MASSRYGSKKNEVFTKRIPENPKYKNVTTTLDTGASVSNYMKKIEEIRKNYRFRKDEIFKRMKVSTFAQLILQVAEVVNLELERQILENQENEENVPCLMRDNENVENEEFAIDTHRSTLHNVVRGIGEVELHAKNCNAVLNAISPQENVKEKNVGNYDPTAPDPSCLPFLLLDIRDEDSYNACHIIGALNYPSTMLTRSVNYLTKDLFNFKNKPGKIVIVYDDDEKLAPNVATVLVQREMDNVIMLSGGMKVLNKKFPGCFLTGTLPSTCFSPVTDRKGKPKPSPSRKENIGVNWYTSDLLQQIQDKLDNVLVENESSRNSSRTTLSSSRVSDRNGTTGSVTSSTSNTTRSNQAPPSQKSWR
ncbi:centrosomal protein of 41 kDa B isoform X2 [Hydra vulgaris]|uniref:Centrosomal protein of 41 kDa B isoform X2 n=1 Tax=Hydra vulgaris TaxID=6087 RepID=A0ABM4C5P1_HYDVU